MIVKKTVISNRVKTLYFSDVEKPATVDHESSESYPITGWLPTPYGSLERQVLVVTYYHTKEYGVITKVTFEVETSEEA
jgi:hypothetical protein